MKYIVWIWPHRWTVQADSVDIALCAIYSWIRTNQHIDFYEWATDEELESAKWRNTYDFKVFNKKKQREYVKFMEKNRDEIIKSINSITDLEKEIIDLVSVVIWDIFAEEKADSKDVLEKFKFIADQIVKLKTPAPTLNQTEDEAKEEEKQP